MFHVGVGLAVSHVAVLCKCTSLISLSHDQLALESANMKLQQRSLALTSQFASQSALAANVYTLGTECKSLL